LGKSVTTYISAPESINGSTFSEASDWWSFGCLLYEMTVAKKPFGGLSFFQLKKQITSAEPHYPDQMNENLKDLIK
jgi:serine/threonine protein kinase